MGSWLRRIALGGAVFLAACGGSLLIVFNSGTIVGAPQCHGAGGQFDLHDQGGLQVLVVITSSTHIFIRSGGTGSCGDLFAGAPVSINGHQDGDRFIARDVTIN
jgi:hypothetical protein